MTDIAQFGKGALRTPPEVAATRFVLGAEVPRAIDWDKGYMVENGFTLKQRDQNGSLSCTGQATCYYCEALEKIEHQKDEKYSARFNYSKSFSPGGGAYIWKAMSIPLNPGTADAASVPDGNSTEAEMTDGSLNGNAIIEARADKYAMLQRGGIDYMAQIVEDYGGFVTGFSGNNSMFDAKGVTSIPSSVDWGHAVYVCGYKKLADGRKALVFKNSWGLWGDNGYGYFPEDFVTSGYMYDAYVYADITDLESKLMTDKEVRQLQALEGYKDEAGVAYWTGKPLSAYLAARLKDKVTTIQNVQ